MTTKVSASKIKSYHLMETYDGRKKVTEAMHKEIGSLIKKRVPVNEIAEQFNISPSTVRYHASDKAREKHREIQRESSRRSYENHHDEILDLAHDRYTKHCRKKARLISKGEGVVPGKKRYYKLPEENRRTKITPEIEKEMKSLFKKGKSYLTIGKELGFSYCAVRTHLDSSFKQYRKDYYHQLHS